MTDPLWVVLLKVIHDKRHASSLVLAPLGTLRDRAHPDSMCQNHAAEGLQGWRPPTEMTGFLFSTPRDGIHLSQPQGSELCCNPPARRAAL